MTTVVIIALAVAALLTLVATCIRRPLVRRIAFRNARRRPREGALVSLGCLLGTALIVGSAAVGSSYTASIQRQALGQLGPLDATITYENRDDWAAANSRLASSPLDGVEVATAVAILALPVTSDRSDRSASNATLIEADYRRATKLLDGDGRGPVTGTAWASPALADALRLVEGATVIVHAGGQVEEIEVARVVARPLATFTATTTDAGINLLVAPGTIAKLQQRDPTRITPRWLTLVSGSGPHSVKPPAAAAVTRLERELTSELTPYNPRIAMVRAERLERAINVGSASSRFLTIIGAFSILSGALLLVNVLLMLAEERQSELGTMRAVGLPRGPLVRAFTVEGAIYAVFGAAAGAGLGVGLGRFMVWIAQKAGQPRGTRAIPTELQLEFSVGRTDVLRGVAAGFLLSLVVAALTSLRISRFDVIRSLRELPAPTGGSRRVATAALWAVAAIAGLATALAIAAQHPLGQASAPTLLTAAIGTIVARRAGWRAGVTTACVPNLLWALAQQTLNKSTEVASAPVVISGIVLVVSGVLLLNAHQAAVAHLLRRLGRGRVTVTSRLGLANPLAHRVRTLLTVGPLALVVFTLAYAEGLSTLITRELKELAPTLAGDYEIYAHSSPASPFDFSQLGSSRTDAVAPLATLIASFGGGTSSERRFWTMTAFDSNLADRVPPRLVSRRDDFSTDRAVFRAVAENPELIIVPSNFLFTPGQRLGRTRGDPTRSPRVGDVYTVFDIASGQGREVTVAGVGYADVVGMGALYGAEGARTFYGPRLVTSGALISTDDDPRQLAAELNREAVANGMDAAVVEDLANEQFEFVTSIVNLYRSDLGIGIVVGVAGIGVVLVRSVRDRRRQIGMLRAIGIDSKQIGWSFLLEGAFVSVQGVVVGAGLGSLMVMALSQSPQIRDVLGFNPPMPMPSLALLLLATGVLVAALLASVVPARVASRIPPAMALRLVD